MKISELTYGIRILIPCPRCERKRSVIFNGPATYREQKARICRECQQDDLVEKESIRNTISNLKSGHAEMISMDKE